MKEDFDRYLQEGEENECLQNESWNREIYIDKMRTLVTLVVRWIVWNEEYINISKWGEE